MEKYSSIPLIVKPFYEAPIRLPSHKVLRDCSGSPLFERFEALFPELLLLREVRGRVIRMSFAAAMGTLRHMQPRHPTRRAAIEAEDHVDTLTMQAFELWKSYLFVANTILQALFAEPSGLELTANLIGARSRIALHHIEELLRAMRAASNAALALEQAAVKEYTESRLGKLINPVLDYFTLRRYEEVYKKKAIGIVTSNLQDLQKDLSNHIVWASQAKDSIEGMAARFPLQKLVEVRRGLTEEDTLVVHCVQAASSEALREAQLYRRELNIALMSQKHQWNRGMDLRAAEAEYALGRRSRRAFLCMG